MRVAARLGDPQAAGGEPGAGRYVLRVAELRCRYPLAAEIARHLELRVRLHDERRAAVGGAGHDADLRAPRFGVGVDGGIRADVGEVDGIGEDRLHGAGPGIVDEPFDLRRPARAAARTSLCPARLRWWATRACTWVMLGKWPIRMVEDCAWAVPDATRARAQAARRIALTPRRVRRATASSADMGRLSAVGNVATRAKIGVMAPTNKPPSAKNEKRILKQQKTEIQCYSSSQTLLWLSCAQPALQQVAKTNGGAGAAMPSAKERSHQLYRPRGPYAAARRPNRRAKRPGLAVIATASAASFITLASMV